MTADLIRDSLTPDTNQQEIAMKILIASSILICALAGQASADWWHGDDVAYGTGEGGEPCDCAPGEDGIDWNGDGLSNSDDAAFADPSLYRPGSAWGTRPGNGADPEPSDPQDARHKADPIR